MHNDSVIYKEVTPSVQYKGLKRPLKPICDGGEFVIDSLMSVILEDEMPRNVVDNSIFRLIITMNINHRGHINRVHLFGTSSVGDIYNYICSILNRLKFEVPKGKMQKKNYDVSIMVKLDFTREISDIRSKMFCR